jgi:plasmid maintenance system antidote protein VapI
MPERSQKLIAETLAWLSDNGVSQRELAAMLEMTPQQLNDILRGRTQLTGEQALHLQEIIRQKNRRKGD